MIYQVFLRNRCIPNYYYASNDAITLTIGLVFEVNQEIFLKAEPWENDYGYHRLPFHFHEYRFKVRVLKVHSDGAYDIKFDCDGSEQMVYPKYFCDTWCDKKEVDRRIELTEAMLKLYEVVASDEEEAIEEMKNNEETKAVQSAKKVGHSRELGPYNSVSE